MKRVLLVIHGVSALIAGRAATAPRARRALFVRSGWTPHAGLGADADDDCAHFYGYGDPAHEPSILQRIVAKREEDVAAARAATPLLEVLEQIASFDANGYVIGPEGADFGLKNPPEGAL